MGLSKDIAVMSNNCFNVTFRSLTLTPLILGITSASWFGIGRICNPTGGAFAATCGGEKLGSPVAGSIGSAGLGVAGCSAAFLIGSFISAAIQVAWLFEGMCSRVFPAGAAFFWGGRVEQVMLLGFFD